MFGFPFCKFRIRHLANELSHFSVLATLLCGFPSVQLFYRYCIVWSNHAVDVSVSVLLMCLFPLPAQSDQGLLLSAEAGFSQGCEGPNLVLPMVLADQKAPAAQDQVQDVQWSKRQRTSFSVGEEGPCGGIGVKDGGWQTMSKGSGSNTCHQLLPPSCAFIKKPSCTPQGNPHALVKK